MSRAGLLNSASAAGRAGPGPAGRRRSAARLGASGLAIAAIVVLGGVFWSALGAFVAAWGSAVVAFQNTAADRAEHFLPPAPASFSPAEPVRVRVVMVPTPVPTEAPVPAAAPEAAVTPTAVAPTPQAAASPTGVAPTAQTGASPTGVPPTAQAAASPTAAPSATPDASPQATAEATPASTERAPWVLLPQPAPGAHVTSGPVQLEARGRGDAPIADIRLELDGRPLPVAVEQRSEVIWRGSATAQVGSGRHSVKAFVVDAQGRTGSYGWSFEAAGD